MTSNIVYDVARREGRDVAAMKASEANQQSHEAERTRQQKAVAKIEHLKTMCHAANPDPRFVSVELPRMAARVGLSSEYKIWRTSSPW